MRTKKLVIKMKRKFEETSNVSYTAPSESINLKVLLEAEKRIVKYTNGDNVMTSEFTHMGSTYYLKEFKTIIGRLEIKMESDIYKFVKSLDEEASSLFPECHIFPGKIVTKAVKGVPSKSLPSEIVVSEKFKNELSRVFDIFHRIGFAHGDFHGNNFYYDEESGKIHVIDLGMSQVSNDIDTWSNTWFSMVPKEFEDSSDDRIFEFFKRLDIVNGWYVHSKVLCITKGLNNLELYFRHLSVFINSKYGWKIHFDIKGVNFHECIVNAVVQSFDNV
jgi:tRNA A-37 threonylcarbamoyl transferase component Bud32